MSETRTIASITPTEREIISLVKGIGKGIAQEGIDYGWSVPLIAAIAYQRGLLEGVASVHREQRQATKEKP